MRRARLNSLKPKIEINYRILLYGESYFKKYTVLSHKMAISFTRIFFPPKQSKLDETIAPSENPIHLRTILIYVNKTSEACHTSN